MFKRKIAEFEHLVKKYPHCSFRSAESPTKPYKIYQVFNGDNTIGEIVIPLKDISGYDLDDIFKRILDREIEK